jgi:hypothetical protein
MYIGGGSGGGGGSPRELGIVIGPLFLDGRISTGLLVDRCGPLKRCEKAEGGETARVRSILGGSCHQLKGPIVIPVKCQTAAAAQSLNGGVSDLVAKKKLPGIVIRGRPINRGRTWPKKKKKKKKKLTSQPSPSRSR